MPASYSLIGGREIDIPADKLDRLMDVALPAFPMVPYDFVVYLAYEDLPQRGVMLGVMMEPAPTGRGLAVKAVTPVSNAERAGLLPGDLLLAIDGEGLLDTFFDKALLSTVGSIGGLFLLVKEYFAGIFCIEKQGLAMRLGKEGGSVAAILRNQTTFCSSHPSRRHF